MLFFLIRHADTNYICVTFIVFALSLSTQGILQYSGILSSSHSKFTITGSFDNPAGFAAALASAFPFCFNYYFEKPLYWKYAAIVSSVIIACAVFLSGSRAGILAITSVTAVWVLTKLIRNNRLVKFVVIGVVIAFSTILYFLKKDSADGRLLIWRSALDMVVDKPVIGHGQGAFQAKYMLYQAAYLDKHPESSYSQLADNTNHPFNEYLLLLSEHGLLGFSVITLLVLLIILAYRQNRNDTTFSALLSLLSLAVFSFFSYPFRYPFTWLSMFVAINLISNNNNLHLKFIWQRKPAFISNNWKQSRFFSFFVHPSQIFIRIALFFLSTSLLAYSALLTRAEITWHRIARQALAGQTEKVLPKYDKLYTWLGKNGLFLYNLAAELHIANEYEKSIAVFDLCTHYLNDMDVQMLIADNYRELEKHTEAEQRYKLASSMCPARFVPLYELVQLYNATGRKEEALLLAKKSSTRMKRFHRQK